MLRHVGKARKFKHNLRLATLLSFIAGLVNITGVLSLKTLTTNVTGHFAFFAEELIQKQYHLAFTFLIYIFSFLLGSFCSGFLTEFSFSRQRKSPHTLSIIFEVLLLLSVAIYGELKTSITFDQLAVSILLFAMGVQNSLVTRISNNTVRTTHLTGLFTDLGIELSQLFFFGQKDQRKQLLHSIELRLAIIFFFFAGCVIGGFLFIRIAYRNLILAAALLVVALLSDSLRFTYYKFRRRNRIV